ncbi:MULTISPECIES: epoxyqueuosine reductase QueH [unclassified Lactococcus]|uniref:epoxyqueuosine reductase QueH n=1 Tax=unclassified Lactococcus TaxID=2643510 RepID=UPI0011CA70D5|nr:MULTISPECIES: epoxyqueuosine reductase QueH [unclassified Lactococcus]MQW22679.1 DNA integration/recombination/inversion protein [Lactococcus sp. dk101]TXK44687.1 epoxyqueuosine reductase QueH [Lactococcus sp. dk310]TXK50581.1 epoxyqueuosine reductase QueH [Lactococcus sp. dk322]
MKNSLEIINKMNSNQKINYDRVFQKVKETWEVENIRPSILLHSCCAPCSTYSLEYLVGYADVTIFFSNSNIHPRSEYERRKSVQEKFISDFNKRTGNAVKFISDIYQPSQFMKMVKEKGLSDAPEGGLRCASCFEMRLDAVAKKAEELGFDYYGSALTISPMKNSQTINEIGLDIQKIYKTLYLPTDFKKNNGYKRSIEMCKEYDIYRQCYCGCVFAAKQQGIDLKAINKEAIEFIKYNQGS